MEIVKQHKARMRVAVRRQTGLVHCHTGSQTSVGWGELVKTVTRKRLLPSGRGRHRERHEREKTKLAQDGSETNYGYKCVSFDQTTAHACDGVHVCVCVCRYGCMHACVYACIHAYMYICMRAILLYVSESWRGRESA